MSTSYVAGQRVDARNVVVDDWFLEVWKPASSPSEIFKRLPQLIYSQRAHHVGMEIVTQFELE
jgi:hypothetical protein